MRIIICGQHEVFKRIAEEKEPPVVVSILDPPSSMIESRALGRFERSIQGVKKHHLFLFQDIRGRKDTNPEAPDAGTIADIVEVLTCLIATNIPTVIIHCQAGISRSTAMGYMLLQLLHPNQTEKDTMLNLRKLRPQAQPNPRMLHLFSQYHS